MSSKADHIARALERGFYAPIAPFPFEELTEASKDRDRLEAVHDYLGPSLTLADLLGLESCSYCGMVVPAPVELHHSEAECLSVTSKPAGVYLWTGDKP